RGNDVWKRWPRSVHAAAQQVCRTRGSEPGWLKKILQLHGPPALPWHAMLRRFVEKVRTGAYHWTPPNRRYLGQGMILPGRSGERLRLAVAIDCSGSTGPVIDVFLRELKGILDSHGRYEVRVLACDTQIRLDERWSDEHPVPSRLELPVDGGSDMRPVFDRLALEPPTALVFLTDGDARVTERTPHWPVLWCLPRGGTRPASWGGALTLPAG
ncbi:MAG: VWA-like domain-containing protein, partial [Wenzhouxiangella sp.]